VTDASGGRSCGVCKRTLQAGDEWIALDGGEIWCAECWQRRFSLPTAGAAPVSQTESGAALEDRRPCMNCGHLCSPQDAACPACGGTVSPVSHAKKSTTAVSDQSGQGLPVFEFAADPKDAGGPPQGAVASGVGGTSSAPPYMASVQGTPGSLSVGSGSPVVHQINIGTMPAAVAASPGKTSGMAVASFVLSLVGIFCLGFITGLLALIFGAVAMNAISKNPGLKGRGLAVAGFIIGIIDVVGWLVWLVIYAENMQRFHF